jgi:hypothetical protein
MQQQAVLVGPEAMTAETVRATGPLQILAPVNHVSGLYSTQRLPGSPSPHAGHRWRCALGDSDGVCTSLMVQETIHHVVVDIGLDGFDTIAGKHDDVSATRLEPYDRYETSA